MTRAWLVIGLMFMFTCVGCGGSGSGRDGGGSGSGQDGSGSGSGQDGGTTDCGYVDAKNDPRCPAKAADVCTSLPTACAVPGLTCTYPGEGDGPEANGCFETAVAFCEATTDAGADTTWRCGR